VALFCRRGALIGQRRKPPPSPKAAYINGYRGIARMMPVAAVLFRQKVRSERHIARNCSSNGLFAAILPQLKTVDKFQKYF
jgi:hypothetical protein